MVNIAWIVVEIVIFSRCHGKVADLLFPNIEDFTRNFADNLFNQPLFRDATKISTDVLASSVGVITSLPIALARVIGVGPPLPSLFSNSNLVALTDNIIAEYNYGLRNEDVSLTIDQLILKYGYPLEEHQVITDDGYLLTMFRIPKLGPPVFLMHGLAASADDFVLGGPESGLAYLLANEGYDVWMGNARGNKHSRHHEYLQPSDGAFWDFSWHEIGYYDLPSMIDYMLNNTDYEKVIYIGHSQGTTSFFVMASLKPEYNNKTSLMIALSPVAFMTNVKSPLIRLLAPGNALLHTILHSIGMQEFLPDNVVTRTLKTLMCGHSTIATIFCANTMFLFGGFSFDHLNVTNLPVIYSHLPAGAAVKQFVHYGQGVVSTDFRQFDHGVVVNLEKYGVAVPPSYPLQRIDTHVSLLCSTDDWLANPEDVHRLYSHLANVDLYQISEFNHFDFLFAKDFKTVIYNRIQKLLKTV